MNLVTARDYDDLSAQAAMLFLSIVRDLEAPLVILPTGNTPIGMYHRLAAEIQAGRVELSHLRPIMLDEYVGIAPDDRRSFFGWLRRELLDPIRMPPEHCLRFDPAADPAAEAIRVEAALAAEGPATLQVFGLGLNGHIGFNEPGSAFDSRTRVVELAPESIHSNAAYWGDEAAVPRRAITLGLGTLSETQRTLLLVSGAAKAEILARVLHGPVTRDVPATFLRTLPHVTVLADRAALAAA